MGVPSLLSYIVGRRSPLSPRKSSSASANKDAAGFFPSNTKRLADRGDEISEGAEDAIPLVGSSLTITSAATASTKPTRPETPSKQRKLRKTSKSLRKLLAPTKSFKRSRTKSDCPPQEADAKTLMTAGWSVLEDDDDDYDCAGADVDHSHGQCQDDKNAIEVDEFLEQVNLGDQHNFVNVPENLVTHSVAQWDPKQGIAFTYSL